MAAKGGLDLPGRLERGEGRQGKWWHNVAAPQEQSDEMRGEAAVVL
jgi:hypothetical protein